MASPQVDTLLPLTVAKANGSEVCEIALRKSHARDARIAGRSSQRLLGAFYTGSAATDVMARWAIRGRRDRVLEPSFGGGEFLLSLRKAAEARSYDQVSLFGCEIMPEASSEAIGEGLIDPSHVFQTDFLRVSPFPVDAVVGNPPYVRLRHLPEDQMDAAMRVARAVLGEPVDASGSVWMSFVLHATRFLTAGGRLALVLPYEFTHVRYARPLWRYLGASFGNLRLVRVHERLFPDLLQEVVVLAADDYGSSCNTVGFVAIDRAKDFGHATEATPNEIPLCGITQGRKEFVEALLPGSVRDRVRTVLTDRTRPIEAFAKFNIGYVAGAKEFFHPSPEAIRDHGIPGRHLRPAVASSRELTGMGLRTSGVETPSRLFLPPAMGDRLARGSVSYVREGERAGINKRYKCKVRNPWYIVPGVRVPDLLLSVFSERPVLSINDAELVASNSLLCGFLRETTADAFASAWYTSLTLLQCELEVHALGGGVFVLVPGEVGRFRLPVVNPDDRMLRIVHDRLRHGDTEGAYSAGDEFVLRHQLGISQTLVDDIHLASATLRYWRTSSRTSNGRAG